MLGVAQAFTAFLNGTIVAFIAFSASRSLHHVGPPRLSLSSNLTSWKNAISRVMYSTMSFFETTVRKISMAKISSH